VHHQNDYLLPVSASRLLSRTWPRTVGFCSFLNAPFFRVNLSAQPSCLDPFPLLFPYCNFLPLVDSRNDFFDPNTQVHHLKLPRFVHLLSFQIGHLVSFELFLHEAPTNIHKQWLHFFRKWRSGLGSRFWIVQFEELVLLVELAPTAPEVD
jgi:hypothetical protein